MSIDRGTSRFNLCKKQGLVWLLLALLPAGVFGQMFFTENALNAGKILYAGASGGDAAYIEFPGKIIGAVAQGPDGHFCFLYANERTLYRLIDREPLPIYTHNAIIRDIAFDADGRLLFSQPGAGVNDGKIFRLEDGAAIEHATIPYFSLRGSWSGSFAIRPSDGKIYISVNAGGEGRLYRMSNSTPQQIYHNPSMAIQKIEFSASGSLIYFTNASPRIYSMSMTTQKMATARETAGCRYGDVLIQKQLLRVGPEAGRINQIALHPSNPLILYAGSSSGGVYRTFDGGAVWHWRSAGVKDPMIGGLLVYPPDPSILIAAAPGGIFRSDNEGRAWSQKLTIPKSFPPPEIPVRIPEMQKSPIRYDALNDAIYAAPFASGVYKSVNRGLTWTRVFGEDIPAPPDRCVFDIEITAENGGTVYLAAMNGLLRNTGGNGPHAADWPNCAPEFTNMSPGVLISPTCVRAAPSNPNRMYVAGGCLNGSYIYQQIWKRDNHASPFQSTPAPEHFWSNQEIPWTLEISPLNSNRVFLGFVDGWESSDAGQHWTNLRVSGNNSDSAVLGVDHRGYAISSDGAALWIAHDQGICRYDIGAAHMEAREKGLDNIQFYDMDISPQGVIYAGNQDRGFFMKRKDEPWIPALNASDVSITVADDVYDHILYYRPPSDLVITYNAISNQHSVSNNIGSCKSNSGNLALVRGSSVMYAGGWNGVYRSNDKGKTFFPANNGLENTSIRCLMTIPGNTETVFAAAETGGLYCTVNGGSSWRLYSGPTSAPILCMTLAPNRLDWYVGAADGLYHSSDTGKTWKTRNDGLPYNPIVSAVTVDSANPSILYAGLGFYWGADLHGGGAYWSMNKGSSWTPLGSGPDQHLSVTSIRQDPTDPARLWIASYGSGLLLALRPAD